MNILGISAYYHDAAACLVRDGAVVAAAQEERFTRKKHDASLPRHAIAFCLQAGGVGRSDLDAVAFYDKPFTKFSRLLSTYCSTPPRAFRSYMKALPGWLRGKLWISYWIEEGLRSLGYDAAPLYFTEHHESHAASAFYASPFASAAVLTMDGVGEWATSTIGVGRGKDLSLLRQLRFPHSLGLLYSAFTYFAGFRVNSGEYKLMGLAPYGEPRYVGAILDEVVDLREDGSFRMNQRYFDYLGGLTMTSDELARLFGGPPRAPEGPITRRELDLARSIQDVTELIVLRMARTAAELTGERALCLAGGVALNCVANSRLLREGPFERIWVQPAAGDAGGALGCALYVWHQVHGQPRRPDGVRDSMAGCYLGPSFSHEEIRAYLDGLGVVYEVATDDHDRARRIARLLADQKVVGLFMGRMEFGPRALGHRSILADARSPAMQSVMNSKIKRRESFRPFAPSVLRERVDRYFDFDGDSPYMTLVATVRESLRRPAGEAAGGDDLTRWANEVRSELPAITHVDYTARLQTVSRDDSPAFHRILGAFEALTGCAVVVNTSFNVRGEPIVCTPADAYRCFRSTGMDALVLERCILHRDARAAIGQDQPVGAAVPLD